MDVRSAYLNGQSDEKVIIEIPEGVRIIFNDTAFLDFCAIKNQDSVREVQKSLYDTEQALWC